ncbi:hypothetical protein ACP4OV_017736 [Aristida adscensionis]
MADNREWMYSGWKRGRPPTEEWVEALYKLPVQFNRKGHHH